MAVSSHRSVKKDVDNKAGEDNRMYRDSTQ